MMPPSSIPVALLASSAVTRLTQSLSDNTFAGIHQLTWFDWMVLIPYFSILAILSVYGLHRYKKRRYPHLFQGATKKKAVDHPPVRFEKLPPVTIQLPLYNERYVVERLIDEVTKIEYPAGLLQIQVLDDSTDDTHPFAEALVERYRALGFPIEYQHRANRRGFKARSAPGGLPRIRHRRTGRDLRRRLRAASGFPPPHRRFLRRPGRRPGAKRAGVTSILATMKPSP